MDEDVTFTRLDPKPHKRFQSLRAELGVSTFGLNLIVLQPGQAGRKQPVAGRRAGRTCLTRLDRAQNLHIPQLCC
jgi:hypothetical protein